MNKPSSSTRWVALLLAGVGLCSWTQSALAQQRTTRSTGTRSSSSSSYPSSTQVGEAIVSSDPETRKLVVITDDETALHIGQVISNLDRAVPQVLIKVVFLEVTYRKGLDIGIEGSHNNTSGSTTNIVSQVFGLASQGSNPAPPGAGMYQLLGSDFQATLRAIAEAGKTEVLSRPSILARNNQQATITVGQRIPLIASSRYDNYGNQINTVEYRDVGIILNVTPFITSEGMVEMIVSPEISNMSDEKVTIAAGVDIPVINSRSADTVVVTPDGQTVVIGGLMQNIKADTQYKIPLLGDIPLLGAAFRRKVTSDAKTELLIFMTPHIVKQPSELAALTASERANAQIVPKAFSEAELNRFLDGLPNQDEPPAKKTKKKK